MRLAAVGFLRGGYVAAKATSDRPGPDHLRALQAADIIPGATVDWAALRYVQPVRDGERYAVGEGDVLIPLRSSRTTAVVARDVPSGVIAVGHWAIISPDRRLVDPDFLAWYLNHPTTTVRLAGLMRGTKLLFLSLADLRDFEIEVPPLRVQRQIARAHALNERVTELERALSAARRQLVNAVAMRALHGAPHLSTELA